MVINLVYELVDDVEKNFEFYYQLSYLNSY